MAQRALLQGTTQCTRRVFPLLRLVPLLTGKASILAGFAGGAIHTCGSGKTPVRSSSDLTGGNTSRALGGSSFAGVAGGGIQHCGHGFAWY